MIADAGRVAGFGPLVWSAATRRAGELRREREVQARLSELVERYNSARQEMFARMDAAESEAEISRIFLSTDRKPYVLEFRELAYDSAGSDTAGEAWTWIVRLGKEDLVEDASEAASVLVADHIESEVLGEFLRELRNPGRLEVAFVRETLGTIREASPHREVQAAAQFILATSLLGVEPDEAAVARGRALLEGLLAEFADVPASARDAERLLFELDHLQVGQVAPDFEAVDQDGATFKLSD